VFGALLEELSERAHIEVIKKCLTLVVAATCGDGNYKNRQELDTFILQLLGYFEDLLRDDFDLMFPLLVDLATVGGKRVQMLLYTKKYHVAMLRKVEKMMSEMSAILDEPESFADAVAAGQSPGKKKKAKRGSDAEQPAAIAAEPPADTDGADGVLAALPPADGGDSSRDAAAAPPLKAKPARALSPEEEEKIRVRMYRIRWILYLFTLFLADKEAQLEVKDPEVRKDSTFESFAKHDLIPVVIRFLKERHAQMHPLDMHLCIFFLALYGDSGFIQQSGVVRELFTFCLPILQAEVVSNSDTVLHILSKIESNDVRMCGPSVPELKNGIFLNTVYMVMEQCRSSPRTSVMFHPAFEFVCSFRTNNERFLQVNEALMPSATEMFKENGGPNELPAEYKEMVRVAGLYSMVENGQVDQIDAKSQQELLDALMQLLRDEWQCGDAAEAQRAFNMLRQRSDIVEQICAPEARNHKNRATAGEAIGLWMREGRSSFKQDVVEPGARDFSAPRGFSTRFIDRIQEVQLGVGGSPSTAKGVNPAWRALAEKFKYASAVQSATEKSERRASLTKGSKALKALAENDEKTAKLEKIRLEKERKKKEAADKGLSAGQVYNKYHAMGSYRMLFILYQCVKEPKNHAVLFDDFKIHETLRVAFEDMYPNLNRPLPSTDPFHPEQIAKRMAEREAIKQQNQRALLAPSSAVQNAPDSAGVTSSSFSGSSDSGSYSSSSATAGGTAKTGMSGVKWSELFLPVDDEGMAFENAAAAANISLEWELSDQQNDTIKRSMRNYTAQEISVPMVATQWSFDQRLLWFRVLAYLLKYSASTLLKLSPKVIGYALHFGYLFLEEYTLGKSCGTMAAECLDVLIESLAELHEHKR
jgi:hypothetical protein